MNVKDVIKEHENVVVIAHYKLTAPYNGGRAPQNPGCLLQITISASNVSPSGKYIRLGGTSGDEIIGWTDINSLEIVEILGILSEDKKTVVPIVHKEPLKPNWPPSWSLEAKEDAA